MEGLALASIPIPSPDLPSRRNWLLWGTGATWSEERSLIKHAGDEKLHLLLEHSIMDTCQLQTLKHLGVWGPGSVLSGDNSFLSETIGFERTVRFSSSSLLSSCSICC